MFRNCLQNDLTGPRRPRGWPDKWMASDGSFFLPGFFTLRSPEEPNLQSFRLAFGALTLWRQGKHLLKMFLPGGWLLPAAAVPEE